MDILNLGCGNKIITPHASRMVVNHDVTKRRVEIDVAHDRNDMPWPWADESFDPICAWSVLNKCGSSIAAKLEPRK